MNSLFGIGSRGIIGQAHIKRIWRSRAPELAEIIDPLRRHRSRPPVSACCSQNADGLWKPDRMASLSHPNQLHVQTACGRKGWRAMLLEKPVSVMLRAPSARHRSGGAGVPFGGPPSAAIAPYPAGARDVESGRLGQSRPHWIMLFPEAQ